MVSVPTLLTPSAIGAANVAGLASGIKFNDVVDKLMAVEQQKVSLLQGRQSTETNKQDALSTLSSDLTSLRTEAQGLADSSSFFVNASTLTSNTTTDAATLLTATPSSTAATGAHTVIVNALAAAEKFVSTAAVVDSSTGVAVTGTTTALGLTGDFTITGQASAAQTVSVSSTDSMQDIVNAINVLNTGANATGVTASILTVNSTSGSEDFRLVITADNTGATNGTTGLASVSGSLVASTGSLADLNIDPLVTATKTVTAADASLTVDGVSGITRDTNSITDVISGFTLDLLKADTTSTITITTAVDQAAVKAKLQSFVDAYNKTMTFINDQMKFDPNTQTSGLLSSDSTVRSIQSQLSSSILASVTGLKSDRNSLVLEGIAPDATGQLVIDDAKVSDLLSNTPTALRDVFAATGTGSVASLSFLVAGLDTVSGTYGVNIATAAAKANVTGTTNLSSGIGAGVTDALTVTDSAGRQAALTLDGSGAGVTVSGSVDGSSLSAIVSALNTEFGTTYTEKRQMSTAMVTGTGSAATSATLLQNLTDGTSSLNLAAGDTITITGTNRSGSSVNASFTVLDPATDTVGDLLSTIQVAFNQQAAATLDSSGKITLTDNTEGDSSLSFTLASSNSSLNARLGADTVVTEGRFAMQLAAAASGNNLQIQASNYGAGTQFAVAQSVADSLGFGSLAIDTGGVSQPATVTAGASVSGTIGGLAATGAGQTLTGNTGNADGLAILYTGTTTGAIGDMTVSLGVGAVYDGLLDTFTNAATGLILKDIASSQTIFDNLQTQINDQNARIAQEKTRLIKQFQQMESIISNLNSTGSFLTQQLNPPRTGG